SQDGTQGILTQGGRQDGPQGRGEGRTQVCRKEDHGPQDRREEGTGTQVGGEEGRRAQVGSEEGRRTQDSRTEDRGPQERGEAGAGAQGGCEGWPQGCCEERPQDRGAQVLCTAPAKGRCGPDGSA